MLNRLTSSVVLECLESRLVLSAGAAGTVLRALSALPVPARSRDLATIGRNRFFVLQPGFTTVFAGMEDGMHKRLTTTVLNKTRVIAGIRTRIVLERQTSNGHLEEISQNYFAIDRRTRNVYYFGEDVNLYKHGVVFSHESEWRAGVNGAKFGLVMLGDPVLGMQYEEERAPGVAQDVAEVVDVGRRVRGPLGTFRGGIQTRETTVLEPDVEEFKEYVPGIGLVRDDTLVLISHSAIRE
jgi:hypothetical protein